MLSSGLGSRGLSLIEMMVAIGIASILLIVLSSSMLKTQRDFAKTQSTMTLMQTQNLMKLWLNGQKAAGVTCAQILKLQTPPFNPAGANQIEIDEPCGTGVYNGSTHTTVRGTGSFSISRIYLDNPVYVRSELAGGTNQKIYLSTLWMEGAYSDGQAFVRRAITAISTRIDPASGTIIECNVPSQESAESNCSDLGLGFVWNVDMCQTTLRAGSNGDFTCAPDLVMNSDGTCHPQSRSCPASQLPQGFSGGVVTGCVGYH